MKCHTFNVLGHVSFPIKLLDCCDHLHCSSSKTVIPSPSFLLFSLEANDKKEMSHIWESATGRMLYLLTLMSCGDVFRVWKQSNISKSNLVLGWLLRYWLNRKTGILPALSSEAFYRAWTWPTHIQCAFFSKPDSGPIFIKEAICSVWTLRSRFSVTDVLRSVWRDEILLSLLDHALVTPCHRKCQACILNPPVLHLVYWW